MLGGAQFCRQQFTRQHARIILIPKTALQVPQGQYRLATFIGKRRTTSQPMAWCTKAKTRLGTSGSVTVVGWHFSP
ncbi:hypothetical protein TYRP_008489 [Tyrophagus putrescentiae]|nr:hypothetical protein TYRP_008489 [Tyrophagus putrescentiae]